MTFVGLILNGGVDFGRGEPAFGVRVAQFWRGQVLVSGVGKPFFGGGAREKCHLTE